MVFKRNRNIVLRNIHGAHFLIDITDNYQDDKCVIYELNEIGKFIWENIDGNNVKKLSEKLKILIVDDIEYEIIYNDIFEYVNVLLKDNFIQNV